MNGVETAGVLEIFNSTWPWGEVTPRTLEVWADACSSVDAGFALDAARRLVRSEERPPSPARFLAEVRVVARTAANRQLAPASTSPPLVSVRPSQALAAIRAGWAAANESRPAHDHHGRCERCETSDEFVSSTAAEILDAIRETR